MSMATAPASPNHSSPEEFEGEDGSSSHTSTQWPQQPGQSSPSATSQSQAPRVSAPLQKRRRVTRACDEFMVKCTYDQPSNRRRNPAPQYIEALEHRLQRAEALLRTVLPNVDLNDPNVDAILQQQQKTTNVTNSMQNGANTDTPIKLEPDAPDVACEEAKLRSMIESTGQLDLDERGHWDFYGGSSGAMFLKRMREQFGSLLNTENSIAFLPRPARPVVLPAMLDSPKSNSMESPMESGLPNTVDLPSRDQAKILCTNALNCACALLRFVHQPTFYEMFDRIYDNSPESYGDEENRYLALLYMVLALGCMFNIDSDPLDEPMQMSYKTSIDHGIKYFRAARGMMDITDCRDIVALQAVLFMILFLQSSANLSTCYSYIGIALRSALRMGMHRNIPGKFTPIERETRRRVFYIIRKMDTYVSALLGFPQMLSSDDIDQDLPLEVDDEYITKDAVLEMPPGKISLYAATNAHTRLMGILTKVIKYIYPIKGLEQSFHGNSKTSYVIGHAKIRDIERDLADWLDKLPMALRPGGEGTSEVLRVQQLLRLAYAHVQMMLYRPFLHYVSSKACVGRTVDDRSYACAAACVSVSRNVVHITAEMKRRGLLIGAYWFTMYTTFFSILSLLFFVLENPDKPGTTEILADAMAGKDALQGLAKRSMAADRCASALGSLFEQLPDRLKTGRSAPVVAKKKRSAPTSSHTASLQKQSSPDLKSSDLGPFPAPLRATTFPTHPPSVRPGASGLRISLDGARFQQSKASDPNLRQSFHELMSPAAEISGSGTPDSISSGSFSQGQPQYNLNQSLNCGPDGLPDLSAMMFPSGDPFAYPNQPMMEFDAAKQDSLNINRESQTTTPMFLSNGPSGTAVYDDLEGQLFGPLPPYLMQGQQNFNMPMDLGSSNGMMGLQPNDMTGLVGGNMAQNADLNFDGIFSGEGDEWNNMLQDQRYS
ncbi:hypothetical protein BP6252_07837 [Coleophoma cylindrospora]|uniref:Xylanolytic transcriptional activator regulatory domain-containing protein n=1 Tax=Coleophoma cylindrospora TaxID=1849047 RepID=A0A3D8RBN4_9HELO|nr:hypothetical protein BP6252_07837 [Coleophoma cylindrospora]